MSQLGHFLEHWPQSFGAFLGFGLEFAALVAQSAEDNTARTARRERTRADLTPHQGGTRRRTRSRNGSVSAPSSATMKGTRCFMRPLLKFGRVSKYVGAYAIEDALGYQPCHERHAVWGNVSRARLQSSSWLPFGIWPRRPSGLDPFGLDPLEARAFSSCPPFLDSDFSFDLCFVLRAAASSLRSCADGREEL